MPKVKSPFRVDWNNLDEVIEYAKSFKITDICVLAHYLDGRFKNYAIDGLSRFDELSARMKRDYNLDDELVWSPEGGISERYRSDRDDARSV